MAEPSWKTDDAEVEALVAGHHDDPFRRLGLHREGRQWIVRTVVPGAESVEAIDADGKSVGRLDRRHAAGFFEGPVKIKDRQALRYLAANGQGTWTVLDAYLFGPVLGPLDDYYMAEGNHLRLYDKLGAHPIRHEGHDGVHFAVWAPNASRVSVVGDFNTGTAAAMSCASAWTSASGKSSSQAPPSGRATSSNLLDSDGRLLPLKSDPFGFHAELRPKTASRVAETGQLRVERRGLYRGAAPARSAPHAHVDL